MRIVLIFLSLFSACVTHRHYLLSKESVQQLDEWELRVLRDFVRGRGRPILERIPLNLEDEQTNSMDSLLDLTNPMIVPQGGLMAKIQPKVVAQLPKVPKPNVPEKDATPSVEDYKQLASVIQMFIDRRAKKVPRTHSADPSQKRESKTANNQLPNVIITAAPDEKSLVTIGFAANHEVNQWRPMQRFVPSASRKGTNPKEVYERRMEELSAELSKLMKKIEEASVTEKPTIIVLRNGSAEQTENGQYTFVATVTLVRDKDVNVLVDTGLGTNINARTALLQSLEAIGLTPAEINVVVTTHGHPDHAGGLHDFPDAVHYQSWYSHHQTHFNLTSLFENEFLNLTESISLIKTRGHTSEDVAVMVRNEQTRGDVLISGDVFMRAEDLDHPMMWQPLSADVAAQKEARRKYGCTVQWIVPGHGPPFQVTSNVKKALKCY